LTIQNGLAARDTSSSFGLNEVITIQWNGNSNTNRKMPSGMYVVTQRLGSDSR